MKNLFLAVGFFLAALSAQASPQTIVKCHGQSQKFPGLYIHLYEDNGVIGSEYTLGFLPLYTSPWTTAGALTTPPVSLPRILDEVNRVRETGIRSEQVAFFQNIFIDGSNRWAIELWKLMDSEGQTLGWLASAHGERMGCAMYRDGEI